MAAAAANCPKLLYPYDEYSWELLLVDWGAAAAEAYAATAADDEVDDDRYELGDGIFGMTVRWLMLMLPVLLLPPPPPLLVGYGAVV